MKSGGKMQKWKKKNYRENHRLRYESSRGAGPGFLGVGLPQGAGT